MSRHPKRALPDPASSEPDRPEAAPIRLLYRLDELVAAFGFSRRTFERQRSAGKFPPPDLVVGKMPLWKPETVRRWIDSGGKGCG